MFNLFSKQMQRDQWRRFGPIFINCKKYDRFYAMKCLKYFLLHHQHFWFLD